MMERKVIAKVHVAASVLAFLFVAAFFSSTIVAELFLSPAAIAAVKKAIGYALIVFVPVMAATGGTGFKLGGKSSHPQIAAKRRRMPFIALNGVFVLVPAALFLANKANANTFDAWFYYVQAVELVAGAVNLTLMGLNIRDGLQLTRKRRTNLPQKEKVV